jgi:xylulokinase
MGKILLSACLCGQPCRYDGKTQPNSACVALAAGGAGLPFCPETAGGLPCPRVPAEIIGGTGEDVLAGSARVVTREGEDVTVAYLAGAEKALELCQKEGITRARLKTRSPSCGCGQIYDGSFSGRTTPGDGVTAALLKRAGIWVIPTEKDEERTMNGYLIGVDLGTSATKTVLFDLTGRTVASASREYPLFQPHTGWAEQDPEDWKIAVIETLREVVALSGVKPREVLAMGISGQMHGMVLLDKEGKVLRPSIIWCDQRTQAECDEMTAKVGRERLIEITANPALTGFTASKILWVKNHQPEIFEKTAHVLLPKDYARFVLTGEFATEVSDASGMQLLDVPGRCWSAEVCDKLGIPISWLPRVYESYEISGTLTPEMAEKTGLWAGMPVGGGAGDNAAGAVGTGVVDPGAAFSTIGTSGVVFAHTDAPRIDPSGRVHTFCHAVPGAWHVMGVLQAAGLSLRWLRDAFCAGEVAEAARLGVDPYEIMTREAAAAAPGCDGLLFLPYLMGERSPHLDPLARGVFFGLTARHTRRDCIRAVMEGVGYGLWDSLSVFREMGVEPVEIRAGGGGGRSRLWRQIQADMLGLPVVTANSKEGGALGVALLAGVGVGVWNSVPEACKAVITTSVPLLPDEETAAVYRRYYPIYRGLYPALKDSYVRLARAGRE